MPDFSTAEDDIEPPVSMRTVVEAITDVNFSEEEEATEETGSQVMTDAFEACVAALGDLVDAYRASQGDAVGHLNRLRLPWSVLFYVRNLARPEWTGPSLFLAHFNLKETIVKDPLDEDEMKRLTTFLDVYQRGHPLGIYVQRTIDAQRAHAVEGDFRTSVSEAYTASEILLDGVLGLLLWEEGADAVQSAEPFNESLSKRMRTHLPGRLGGNWMTSGSGIVDTWSTKTALLRHRVVHAGYRPTEHESDDALIAASDLEEFVKNRLVACRTRYPRTTLLFLGREGLEQRGHYSGQIKRFVEQEAVQEPDWIIAHRAWRDELDAVRA